MFLFGQDIDAESIDPEEGISRMIQARQKSRKDWLEWSGPQNFSSRYLLEKAKDFPRVYVRSHGVM